MISCLARTSQGVKTDLCEVCDDVMGDLLKGSDGVAALPCSWACLRIPACMRMCEVVKTASQNSSHFPCIAAGYCDPIEEGGVDAAVECSVAPPLRCVPSRYCVRKFHGLRMSCQLRPGIGRWVGMRNAVGSHAAALADGLWAQPRCGERMPPLAPAVAPVPAFSARARVLVSTPTPISHFAAAGRHALGRAAHCPTLHAC